MSSDLREQLQASLAGSYTVERELGGGMSRVFVARETRLKRQAAQARAKREQRAALGLSPWLGLALCIVGCSAGSRSPSGAPLPTRAPGSESFVTRLGNDTVAVERFIRSGDSVTGDFVYRAPTTSVLHYRYHIDGEGNLRELNAELRDSSRSALARWEIAATPGGFNVRTSSTGDSSRKFVRSPPSAIPALIRPLAIYELATVRLRRARVDSIVVPTIEFDTIGVDSSTFKLLSNDSVWTNVIFPRGERLRVDGAGRILDVNGTSTSYKWITERVPDLDILALERTFAARDAKGTGLGSLSSRDTASLTISGAQVTVEYGRPSKRGRAIFGSLVPWEQVWRTGADKATELTTTWTLRFDQLVIPPGSYSLYTIPSPHGWTLVINRHTGHLGLRYFPKEDLGRVDLPVRITAEPKERLTITLAQTGEEQGVLRIAWDSVVAEAPFTVRRPTLALVGQVDKLGELAREPMIVEHPNGALFVSGYGLPGPKLWKSSDRGVSWERVNVGAESDGAVGNSDVDLAVGPDSTLYFVTMNFDREAGEGTQIAVGVSRNAGASWRWTTLSKVRFDDRPWIVVSRDGTAHVIWNDGSGVCHALSRDHGVTWTRLGRITTRGGSSHFAAGPRGQLAVRVAPASASGNKFDADVDLIAVSLDGGSTWKTHPAPGTRHWPEDSTNADAVPRWIEPLAWDAAGALFSLWTDRDGLWLARSLDNGESWTTWPLLKGGAVRYYPYMVGGSSGQVAATWTAGFGDGLRAHVGVITIPRNGAPPVLLEAEPFTPETFGLSSRHEDPTVRRSAGEYLPVTFLNGSRIVVVSPIQDEHGHRFGFAWRVFRSQ